MGQQDLQYAKKVSDATLKSKGQFDDSIRLNRRQQRKAKDGKSCLAWLNICRTKEGGKAREASTIGLAVEDSVGLERVTDSAVRDTAIGESC